MRNQDLFIPNSENRKEAATKLLQVRDLLHGLYGKFIDQWLTPLFAVSAASQAVYTPC